MWASVFRERTRSQGGAAYSKRAQPKPPSETDTSLGGVLIPRSDGSEAAAGSAKRGRGGARPRGRAGSWSS